MAISQRVFVSSLFIATSIAGLGCTLDELGTGSGGKSSTASTTSADASTVGVGGYSSAPPTPELLSLGGPVLAKPKAIAITYDSDANQGGIDAFVAKIGASQYWMETTQEYGVGALTALPPIHLTDKLSLTITVNSADHLQKGEPFSIVSSLNGRTSITYGMVGN